MSVNRSRHIVALVSLLVFLLAGQAGAQGYVWCLGEDGHTALEYAAGNSCASAAQPQSQTCHDEEISALPSQEEHCGPCLDLPASIEATSRSADTHKRVKIQIGSPAIVRAVPVHKLPSVLAPDPHPQESPRISRTILLQRTVVFLI